MCRDAIRLALDPFDEDDYRVCGLNIGHVFHVAMKPLIRHYWQTKQRDTLERQTHKYNAIQEKLAILLDQPG